MNIISMPNLASRWDASRRYLCMLQNREIFRLPRGEHTVEVASGSAWITVDQRDILLCQGEMTCLWSYRHPILISALGSAALVIDILTPTVRPWWRILGGMRSRF